MREWARRKGGEFPRACGPGQCAALIAAGICPSPWVGLEERGSTGQVAQLVEHVTENHGVGGSTPSLAIREIGHLHTRW
jgi:hypothetical protein